MNEPVCKDKPHPFVKPGIYDAECYRYVIYTDPQFKRAVCMLKFRLTLEGVEMVHFLNLGDNEHPHPGRRSLYRCAWIVATGNQPRKSQVMSPRVFTQKLYEVEVGSPSKRWDGTERSPGERYSVVKRIIRRIWEPTESVNHAITKSTNQGRHEQMAVGSASSEISDA